MCYNYYGPTELGEITAFKPILQFEALLIGKVFPNNHCYVLDVNRNLVPEGVVGELYVSGVGVARGYLNNPDLTNERFIVNSFVTELDKLKGYSHMYKTGDLVKWTSNGDLVYIGRNDDQIKIRGYRVELGEIEQVLLRIEGIKQCCVIVKERKTDTSHHKYLVSYHVWDEKVGKRNQSYIKDRLQHVLPDYMIPSFFVKMEKLPLTSNGKLDKWALPDPDLIESYDNYVSPKTEIEKELCNIWQNILGVEKVGMTDNFFNLGGNSIMAIYASHSMSKKLGYEIKVADLFKLQCIEGILKNYLDNESKKRVLLKFQ